MFQSKYKLNDYIYSYYNTKVGRSGALTAVCTEGIVARVYQNWLTIHRGEKCRYAISYLNPKYNRLMSIYRHDDQIFETEEECKAYVEKINKRREIERQAREYVKEALNE